MRSIVGLVDCNNFYVSCERTFAPHLMGQPVGVLSNNDGCVIARSEELKALGVSMGMPTHKIPREVRRRITLCSSNYALYGDMSARVTSLLRQHCHEVDVYSIDESFLHWPSAKEDDIVTRCLQMKYEIHRNTGIPVSVGLSTSRTLAKVASHLVKKQPAYEGVCYLDPEAPSTRHILENLPVDKIWGVSSRLKERLVLAGIHTAWQLREADPKWIRARFSVVQEKLVYELRGVSCIQAESSEPKQNIMTSRSFGRQTNRYEDVREALTLHAQHGAEKLRRQGSVAQAVMLFLKTNKHNLTQPQYSPTHVVSLVSPTDDTRPIIAAVQQGLSEIWREGFIYMKCGCMMLDLLDKERVHTDLFHTPDDAPEQRQKLLSTVDKINQTLGRDTITFGVPLDGKRADAVWHLRSQFCSPRYTTRWADIPEAKI